MRKYFALLSLLILPVVVSAFDIPARPTGFVQDYASLLTSEEKAQLEGKLNAFEKSTTNEIAVVTIPSLGGDTIENVAQNIFTQWGIGKKDKNNGVLLLISLSDRETRIHTGYGVEGDLTDLGTHYIQDEIMTPAFQAGKFYDGINGAVDKMIQALGGNEIVPEDYSTESSSSQIPVKLIVFGFFVIFQILAAILGRSKSWWHGGVLGGVVALIIWHFFINSVSVGVPAVIGLIGTGLMFDYIVSRAYSQKQSSGHYPWWFGGGGHGGFGGGGFGGFGGGGSGGGGSSGRW